MADHMLFDPNAATPGEVTLAELGVVETHGEELVNDGDQVRPACFRRARVSGECGGGCSSMTAVVPLRLAVYPSASKARWLCLQARLGRVGT
jgi:hypothetical protein